MVVVLKYIFATLWYCICILSCIDTGHFVYPSLSQTLYPSVLGLLTVVLLILICLFKKRIPDFSKAQIAAILLAAYISFHGLVIKDAELYKQGYTVCTLLFMVALTEMVRTGIIAKRHIENGIILISVINVSFLVAQFLGLINSGNSFFQLTGANGNPNTAAIALTISIPFAIQRLREGKHLYGMSSLLLLVAVFLLIIKCRTAFIGVVCIIVCYALRSSKTRLFVKKSIKKKTGAALFVGIAIVIATLATIGYNWKKDSANGRIFIWQRNCEMIADAPLGYGYGKYEVEYNLYQSQYFATHKEEYRSSNLATASSSAYNDLLEHGVQGGLIGGVLYLLFLLTPLFLAYRERQWTCFLALFAVLMMSVTNSICCSISPWMMTISTMALVASSSKDMVKRLPISMLCLLSLVLLAIPLLNRNIQLLRSQKLFKSDKVDGNRRIEEIRSLYPAIGTSEAYWQYLAECHEKTGNYKAADKCYTEARKYTAAPLLLFRSAQCKENIGDTASALKIMKTAVCMLPRNLSLKYHLMMMYDSVNDKDHARQIAHEIVSTPEKTHHESILFIKDQAAKKLNE